MIRAARNAMLVGAVVTVVAFAAPAPASALSPVGAICSLTGLVSTLAGKACDAASHAGRFLSAGTKLVNGHVGGALKAITGTSKVAKAATAAVGIAAIVASVVGGARYLLGETAKVIGSTTRPNLVGSWFSASYWRMAGVAALLTLPFLFAAAIQALVRSDLAMLGRAAFGYLPLGLLGVAVAAPLTMLLLAGSDEMSAIVSSASGHADGSFLDRSSGIAGIAVLIARTPFVAFFIGLIIAAATLTLWIELLIRDAAVYIIVLMLPLFFAAMVWPARRIWAIRAVELLVALILSKFAIVAVLSLGGAALGHTVLPGPAADLAGATLVLLAAFSPWALLRMLPLHELASAAAGGLRPHGAWTPPAQRADAASDRLEHRGEPEAGAETPRELPDIVDEPAADRDVGATNGSAPPGDGVSAGPGNAAGGGSAGPGNAGGGFGAGPGNAAGGGSAGPGNAAGAVAAGGQGLGAAGVAEADDGAAPAPLGPTPIPPAGDFETASYTATTEPLSSPSGGSPEGGADGRGAGMDARWQMPDDEWGPVRLGRREDGSPATPVVADDPRAPGAPGHAEDDNPLPPAEGSEDHEPPPPTQGSEDGPQ